MAKLRAYLILMVFIVGVLALAFLFRSVTRLPSVVGTEVRDAIYTAIQSEADTAFVITGYIEVVATTRSSETLVLLPELLNLSLGTTTATVRVPGRVAYGFDVSEFNREMIHVRGDTVEIQLPLVRVFSAEPDLARLEVETRTGWARAPASARETQTRAVQLLSEALRQQGEAHVRQSTQPQVNTARALRRIAEPVAVVLGVEEPMFRIFLGEDFVMEP